MKRWSIPLLIVWLLLSSFVFSQQVVRRPISAGITVFLSHFDGVDGATTAVEEKGHTLTFNSNAQLDTAQFVFGTASALFALTDDTITTPDSNEWTFGAGENFTVQLRVRFNNTASSAGNQIFISHYNNVGNQRSWHMRLTGGNTLEFFASGNGSTTLFSRTRAWTPSDNVDYYIAAGRTGTSFTLCIDNSAEALTNVLYDDAFFDSNEVLRIGAFNSSGINQEFDGWIDELRITKGHDWLNGVCTVPAGPFTD